MKKEKNKESTRQHNIYVDQMQNHYSRFTILLVSAHTTKPTVRAASPANSALAHRSTPPDRSRPYPGRTAVAHHWPVPRGHVTPVIWRSPAGNPAGRQVSGGSNSGRRDERSPPHSSTLNHYNVSWGPDNMVSHID